MILPYSGCFTRRSTRTTTVFSPLSDTTVPVRTRFGIPIFSSTLRRFGGAGALVLKRLDAGDGATHLAHPRRLLELVGRRLETQVELLALQLGELLLQLVVAVLLEILDRSHSQCSSAARLSPRRATTLVLIGNFSAARSNAVLASEPGTPSSSNRMRPGLTRATQNSGLPLPEPMRTSAGFELTGTSGNTRIHKRPERLM